MADKTDAPKPDVPAKPPTRLLRSKDFRVTYVNTLRIRIGTLDSSITFGYQSEVPGPGGIDQPIVQDEIEIVLTLPFFKLLTTALSDNLEQLEKAIGSISLPAEFIEAIDAARAKMAEEGPKLATASGKASHSEPVAQ